MWLKLSKAGPEGVRLLWGTNDGPYDPYHIGLATLAAACEAVRNALAEVVHVYGSEEVRVRARALRNLANAGAELHYVLFDSTEEIVAANCARDAIADNYSRGDNKLRITGHPEIHVPWALVFEESTDDIPLEADGLDSFGGFWGLKYALSSTLSGYNQPPAKLTRKSERSKLLSLMNHAAATQAYNRLSEEFRAAYTALLNRPVGVAHDLESCRKLIEQAVSYDTILHIFSHQSGGKLDLGDDETISIVKFKMLLDRLTEKCGEIDSYSLVILSACESAAGDMDYSFASATNRAGICGLIGTEAVVPRDFAALFATRLLTLMLGQGKSVGESIAQLRHEPTLWPLSLLYGCYAQPNYRISVENMQQT